MSIKTTGLWMLNNMMHTSFSKHSQQGHVTRIWKRVGHVRDPAVKVGVLKYEHFSVRVSLDSQGHDVDVGQHSHHAWNIFSHIQRSIHAESNWSAAVFQIDVNIECYTLLTWCLPSGCEAHTEHDTSYIHECQNWLWSQSFTHCIVIVIPLLSGPFWNRWKVKQGMFFDYPISEPFYNILYFYFRCWLLFDSFPFQEMTHWQNQNRKTLQWSLGWTWCYSRSYRSVRYRKWFSEIIKIRCC